MSNLKTYSALLALPILTSMSCRPANRASMKDVVPFSVGDVEPSLGQSYDSLVQDLRNSPNCVVGTAAKTVTARSQLDLSHNATSDTVMKEFSGEVNGTSKFVFVDAGAAAGFYRSLNRSKSAWNIIYVAQIDTGSEQLRSVTLNKSAKALSGSSLLETCGDEYVVQLNRGGLLSITLSLDFTSEELRRKWESKLNLSGAWGELKKDLTNKIQTTGIDGSLTIKVNQLGGIPSQSLLAVRSCPLSTVEEFNVCKQHVDEIMAYASNDFPKQVESNPAILNYVTSPLRKLGVSGLPTLSDEILKIRADLEKMRQDSLEFEAAVNLAKEKNVEMDSNTVSSVAWNRDQIKQAAKSCYNYEIKNSAPDFSICKSKFNQLKVSLKPLSIVNIDVNELNVNADSETGNSIVNGKASTMTVAFAVGSGRGWDYGKNFAVGIDGIPTTQGQAATSSNALSPGDKLGSLLIRVGTNYRRVESSGHVDIPPGESVAFVMNDNLGEYGNNKGVQQVYWRCINCRPNMEERQTYRLRLKASDLGGASLSRDANQSGSFHIATYGRWRAGTGYTFSDSRGLDKRCGGSCALSDSNTQSLIMKQGNQAVFVGGEARIMIKPNARAFFVMNDQNGGYSDNQGEIEIIIQCIQCNIKSHALILDPEDET